MQIKRLSAVTAALAVVGLALSACGSGSDDKATTDTGAQLVKAGTLTVCSDVPYPPFEDFDKTSETGFKGFDVDVMSAVAEHMKVDLVIKDSAFDALEGGTALASGQCDVAASAMTITEDRKKALDFTRGYYDSKQSLLVPADSTITSIDGLAGVKVGVQKATTGKTYAEEHATGAQLIAFPGDAEMWAAIQAGQVGALLQDLPVNLSHAEGGKYKVIETYDTAEEYGFAVKKGNTQLATDINAALDAMDADGSYQKLYDTYFSTTK